MKQIGLLTLAVALALAGCSGGKSGSDQSAASGNPVGFPLYDPSTVLTTHDWRQTVTAAQTSGFAAGTFSQGAGTYAGHEVIAQTGATMPQLEAWMHGLDASPPPGYEKAVTGNAVEAVRGRARALGIDFAAFDRVENGKRRGVLVMAIDPIALNDKAGPVLGALEKFKLMPQMLRDPLDAQSKKQFGFTVTEATEPTTPIGAAVAALETLRNSNGRGIVLIDAVKQ